MSSYIKMYRWRERTGFIQKAKQSRTLMWMLQQTTTKHIINSVGDCVY